MKLVDTSVWIPALRPRGDPGLRSLVRDLIAEGIAAINGTILLELLVRARDEREYTDFREGFAGIANFPAVARTWDIAANLGFRLHRIGLPTPIPDLMIAASAIEHDAVLVHADSDFDRIAQHSDLKVKSYVAT